MPGYPTTLRDNGVMFEAVLDLVLSGVAWSCLVTNDLYLNYQEDRNEQKLREVFGDKHYCVEPFRYPVIVQIYRVSTPGRSDIEKQPLLAQHMKEPKGMHALFSPQHERKGVWGILPPEGISSQTRLKAVSRPRPAGQLTANKIKSTKLCDRIWQPKIPIFGNRPSVD
ncbi:hypothetical protein C8J57DRAFT_1239250 [Mycena rebaudengoi]|nr:hypothetical protein C8J57DRAFT_1239250 [Mycena rebaudengoi]